MITSSSPSLPPKSKTVLPPPVVQPVSPPVAQPLPRSVVQPPPPSVAQPLPRSVVQPPPPSVAQPLPQRIAPATNKLPQSASINQIPKSGLSLMSDSPVNPQAKVEQMAELGVYRLESSAVSPIPNHDTDTATVASLPASPGANTVFPESSASASATSHLTVGTKTKATTALPIILQGKNSPKLLLRLTEPLGVIPAQTYLASLGRQRAEGRRQKVGLSVERPYCLPSIWV